MTVMLDEIREQPEAIAATLDTLLPLRPRIRELVAGRRQLLLFGRGTSDNAATYGRYLLETHAGLGAALGAPSLITHYGTRRDLTDTVAVVISQSGRTEEMVEVEAWARTNGARTITITNEPDSPLAAATDLLLATSAGPERAVPATKTYTTQLATLAVLADGLAAQPGRLEADLRAVPAAMQHLLETTDPGPAAAQLTQAQTILVSGRGLTYGTALELALKLEETCLTPVRGLSYADLRHGPIAAVDDQTVATLVAPADGPILDGIRQLHSQLRTLGAATVLIGGDPQLQEHATVAMPGPHLPEATAPLALILPAQLLVERTATLLGVDPDNPRNLTKVTQTEA